MAKGTKGIDKVDPRQMSLLELLEQAQSMRESITDNEGSMNIHGLLCRALTRAISDAVRSAIIEDRYDLAAKMSRLLGIEVTKYVIDSWTAESKEANRIPAEYLPAFCSVTGNSEPLQVLTDTAGLYCLPGPEALRAEIQKLREQERKISADRRRREMFLKEMEGE